MGDMRIIQTDSRGRLTLPGHPNEQYGLSENSDGSILLTPGRFVTEAQHQYDTTPELRTLLHEAASAPTVKRNRRERQSTTAA